MALKQKKSRILRKAGGSSRYWNLANLRRQWKKKQARIRSRRCSKFYNLQLDSQCVEVAILADTPKETA